MRDKVFGPREAYHRDFGLREAASNGSERGDTQEEVAEKEGAKYGDTMHGPGIERGYCGNLPRLVTAGVVAPHHATSVPCCSLSCAIRRMTLVVLMAPVRGSIK